MYSYTSAISLSLNDIFKSSNLNLGLSYTFNRVNYSNSNQNEEINLNDNAGNFSIGVQYSNKNQSEKNTKVGLSYTTSATFEQYIKNSFGFTIIVRDNKAVKSLANETLVKANIPDQFNADLSTYLSDKLNLNIAEGEIFGFLGPNGAGKTTTMKIMAGRSGKRSALASRKSTTFPS